jgi:hypothetical protein
MASGRGLLVMIVFWVLFFVLVAMVNRMIVNTRQAGRTVISPVRQPAPTR